MSHTPSPSLAVAVLTETTGDSDPDTLRAATRDLQTLQRYAHATNRALERNLIPNTTYPISTSAEAAMRPPAIVREYVRTTASGSAAYRAVWSPSCALWLVFRRRPAATTGASRWVIEALVPTPHGAASDTAEIVTAQYRDAPPNGRV